MRLSLAVGAAAFALLALAASTGARGCIDRDRSGSTKNVVCRYTVALARKLITAVRTADAVDDTHAAQATEHLVEVGELEPDLIHTPSIYVKRIFQGEVYEKKIERRTVRKG